MQLYYLIYCNILYMYCMKHVYSVFGDDALQEYPVSLDLPEDTAKREAL